MVDKATLYNWILKVRSEGPLAGPINGNTSTGIIAYVKDDYYHFRYQVELKEKSHIYVLDITLDDCFNYVGVGLIEKNKDPLKEPTYSKEKLDQLCEKILTKLKDEGKFELVLIGNTEIKFIKRDS